MQLDEVKHILSLGEIEMDCLMDATLAKEEQYKKLENYEYEVWCFWVDYLNYQKQMLERNIVPKKIVDIGCHLGIQSIIFDCPYLGIEAWDNRGFFWEKRNQRIHGWQISGQAVRGDCGWEHSHLKHVPRLHKGSRNKTHSKKR